MAKEGVMQVQESGKVLSKLGLMLRFTGSYAQLITVENTSPEKTLDSSKLGLMLGP